MSKRAFRAAAGVAVLGILLGLALPATSHAAAVRDDGATVSADRPASAGVWRSLADLWDGLVAAVFAGSEDEGSDEDHGADDPNPPTEDGEGDPENDGDTGPGADPNG